MTDDIMAYPLQGYSTATVKGQAVLLRLDLLARHPGTGQEVLQPVPLQLTAHQARELGKSLLTAAEATEMGQSPTPTRN